MKELLSVIGFIVVVAVLLFKLVQPLYRHLNEEMSENKNKKGVEEK